MIEIERKKLAQVLEAWATDLDQGRQVWIPGATLRKAAGALAQPEQEPLEYWNAVEGWVKIDEVREHFDSVGCGTIYKAAGEDRVPVYTTPPKREWVGLMRGVRVEKNTVVISVGSNEVARELCHELILEMAA